MKAFVRVMVAGAALGVAGCSSLPGANLGDTFLVESFIDSNIEGGSYTAELAKAYQERADYEANTDSNWYDATAFYRKGQAALAGEEVLPWDPASLGVTGDAVKAYQETLAASAAYKDVRPAACAKMTALYDHWVEELSEGSHSVTNPGEMQGKWSGAYYECSGGVAASRAVDGSPRWTIYFGFNRASLDAEARGIVDDVVSAVKGLSSPVLSVVGHTDTVGSTSYNQALSEKRARNVATALTRQGVPASSITTAGRSENELAVPTADGVREAKNRRVEVTVSE